MADSSSTEYTNNPSDLPQQFTFVMSREEVTRVKNMARRFAPLRRNGYRIQVQFGATERIWAMWEHNVIGYQKFDDFNEPHHGFLTLTLNALEFMAEMGEDDYHVSIAVDFSSNSFTASTPTTSFTLDLPLQKQSPYNVLQHPDIIIKAAAADVARMGHFLDDIPVPLDEENLPDHVPFLEFSSDYKKLTASRNWAGWDAGVVSFTIPVTASQPHNFSCFPSTLPRELYFSDLNSCEEVRFLFSTSTPHLMFVEGDNWGMRVELGVEIAYKYRGVIERHLTENGVSVDTDPRIGFDPVIQCSYNDVPITLEIMKGSAGVPDYVRLSHTVLTDCPWNLDIATEINDWNNSWQNVKLVYRNNCLEAVREINAENIQQMSEAVIDVASKSEVVSQVVNIFI